MCPQLRHTVVSYCRAPKLKLSHRHYLEPLSKYSIESQLIEVLLSKQWSLPLLQMSLLFTSMSNLNSLMEYNCYERPQLTSLQNLGISMIYLFLWAAPQNYHLSKFNRKFETLPPTLSTLSPAYLLHLICGGVWEVTETNGYHVQCFCHCNCCSQLGLYLLSTISTSGAENWQPDVRHRMELTNTSQVLELSIKKRNGGYYLIEFTVAREQSVACVFLFDNTHHQHNIINTTSTRQ